MSCKKFIAEGQEFEFYIYSSNELKQPAVAVDVKFREGMPELPRGYTKKLQKLEAEFPGVTDRIFRWACESVGVDWWANARQEAKELHLGDVASCGRSGGWLVLPTYTVPALERLVENAEESCKNCRAPYAEHVKGTLKCLFDTGTWVSASDSLLVLRKIQAFLTTRRASITKGVVLNNLRDEIKFFTDDEFEAQRRRRKEAKDGNP